MKADDIDKIIAEAVADSQRAGRRHKSSRQGDGVATVRMVLNWVFMLGFAAAVVIYFALPDERALFFSVGFGAIVLKLVEFYLRFMF